MDALRSETLQPHRSPALRAQNGRRHLGWCPWHGLQDLG